MANHRLEADDLPLTYCQKVTGSLTLYHHAYVIPLTSSHRIGILSSTASQLEERVLHNILQEKDHIHIVFITAYY